MIWERLKWSLLRRHLVARRVERFSASGSSYVSNTVSFEGFNHLYSGAVVRDSTIGRFSYIAEGAKVVNTDLGRFCSIGPGALIGGLGAHPTDFVSTHPVFYSPGKQAGGISFSDTSLFNELPRVSIGHDVWVGARAVVLDGVTVGDGAIIAACALVNKDVSPYDIVGGVPARVIRSRFDQATVKALHAIQWWNWAVKDLERFAPDFRSPPVTLLNSLKSRDHSRVVRK